MDRVAIVTGGGQGLGRAYALRLARDGIRVLVADILSDAASQVASEISRQGGIASSAQADVTDAASVHHMVTQAIADLGGADILINNAGGAMYPFKPFDEIEEAQWDHVVGVNLKGQWLCARACAATMKAAGWGRIVNISSGGIFVGGPIGSAPYIAAKAGAVGLTRSLARELGPYGITVNAITPGYVPVSTPKRVLNAAGFEALGRQQIDMQVLKRIGTPDDLSGVVAFIVSDDASWITGQVINVDGGWNFH